MKINELKELFVKNKQKGASASCLFSGGGELSKNFQCSSGFSPHSWPPACAHVALTAVRCAHRVFERFGNTHIAMCAFYILDFRILEFGILELSI